jgi:EAL domain-containing protein (putative c-di-GMP-specific phosphodiesterase class I)
MRCAPDPLVRREYLWTAVPICNAPVAGGDAASAIGHLAAMLIADTLHDRRGANDRRGGGRRLAELGAAIGQGQVEILYQPQFACADGRLAGAEALSRWNHPRLGRIGAEALFDIAERAGHGAELTRHIAGRALRVAAGWPEPLRLSLNVTAADLTADDFADTILTAAAEANFAPGRLTLEITEQALVAELDRSAAQLERLAASGVGIALDDFGAGFCNFRYLKRLPLHWLKLDRSMIEGIVDDERDLAVLRGIVAMARALRLKVVAEGIETEAQRAAIVREGCDKWQGFLGGAPMAAGDFAALVRRQDSPPL